MRAREERGGSATTHRVCGAETRSCSALRALYAHTHTRTHAHTHTRTRAHSRMHACMRTHTLARVRTYAAHLLVMRDGALGLAEEVVPGRHGANQQVRCEQGAQGPARHARARRGHCCGQRRGQMRQLPLWRPPRPRRIRGEPARAARSTSMVRRALQTRAQARRAHPVRPGPCVQPRKHAPRYARPHLLALVAS